MGEVPPLLFVAARFTLVVIPAVFLVPRPTARWQWVAAVGILVQALRFVVCWLILGSKFTAHPFDGVNPRLWIGSIGYMVVFALIGLVVNLISDLTYTWIDPRIDFETREV